MRGTEYPQMSASSSPTVSPSVASAMARFTAIEDLPTPPFPDAISSTLVVIGISVSGAFSATFRRAIAMAAALASAESSVQEILTPLTPGREPTRVRTSRWICARRGQPMVVSATVTVT